MDDHEFQALIHAGHSMGPSPTVGGGHAQAVEPQLSQADIDNSLMYAQKRAQPGSVTGLPTWQQRIQLIKHQTPLAKARNWRVQLGAIQRVDGAAIVQYDPATQPPLGNSVGVPGHSLDGVLPLGNPTWVEVQWGLGGAPVNRMVAHWPARGGSFDVVANYVQVTAFFQFNSDFAGFSSTAQNASPVFTASMGPAEPQASVLACDLGFSVVTPLLQPSDPTASGPFARMQVPPFARMLKLHAVVGSTLITNQMYLRWRDRQGNVVAQSAPSEGYLVNGVVFPIDRWEPVPGAAQTVALEIDVPQSEVGLSASWLWRITP